MEKRQNDKQRSRKQTSDYLFGIFKLFLISHINIKLTCILDNVVDSLLKPQETLITPN